MSIQLNLTNMNKKCFHGGYWCIPLTGAEFLSSSTSDILRGITFCGDLSCVLQDVYQYPQSPHNRFQWHTPRGNNQKCPQLLPNITRGRQGNSYPQLRTIAIGDFSGNQREDRKQFHLGQGNGKKTFRDRGSTTSKGFNTIQNYFTFKLNIYPGVNGNPLQCSCLENPTDGGAWWAAICGVAQSWTRLK